MGLEQFPDRLIDVWVRPVMEQVVEARAAPFNVGERGASSVEALGRLHLWLQDGCIAGRVVYRVRETLEGGREIEYLLPDDLARRQEAIAERRDAALCQPAREPESWER